MKRRSFLALGAAAAAAPLLPPIEAAGANTTVTEALMGFSHAVEPRVADVFLTDEAAWALKFEWERVAIGFVYTVEDFADNIYEGLRDD